MATFFSLQLRFVRLCVVLHDGDGLIRGERAPSEGTPVVALEVLSLEVRRETAVGGIGGVAEVAVELALTAVHRLNVLPQQLAGGEGGRAEDAEDRVDAVHLLQVLVQRRRIVEGPGAGGHVAEDEGALVVPLPLLS